MLSSRAMSVALAVAAAIVASAHGNIDLELIQLQAQPSEDGAASHDARGRSPWFTYLGVPVYRDERARRSPDEVHKLIIVLQSDATDKEVHTLAKEVNGSLEGHPDSGALPFVKGDLDQTSLKKVLENHQNRVRYVEEDVWANMIPPFEQGNGPGDPARLQELSHNYPWNIIDVNAHLVRGKGAGVHVYVLDTGVRTTHTGFGGRAVPTLDVTTDPVTWCSAGDTTCAADDNGHGTHCAGTVAAETHGAANGATIHAVKVLDGSGYGSLSGIVYSLEWIYLYRMNPAVVSMSLAGPGSSSAVQDSVEILAGAGVPVVVAAGNGWPGQDSCGYWPANVGLAITVGAYGLYQETTRYRPWWSHYGPCVDVWAPGVDVPSLYYTSDSGIVSWSGTSMAAPLVAGLMARILEAYPTATSMTPLQRFALLTTNNRTGTVVNIPISPPSPNVVPLAAPDPPTALARVSAKGDPHLTNIYGQRFDLTKPGKHVLLHIPRHTHHEYLLDVSALAERIGEACTDLYFQELNVTGKWVDDVRQTGGFRFTARDDASRHGDARRQENVWMRLGSLKLKVVRGKTLEGVHYLNLLVKGLGSVAMSLGGLLGEDDHSAETPPPGCERRLSVGKTTWKARAGILELAEASPESLLLDP